MAERIATVDEEPAARHEHPGEALERTLARGRVPTIERSDAHGERQVVALLARFEFELLGCGAPSGQPPGTEEIGCRRADLGDGLGRAVDGENVAVRSDPFGHDPGSGTRSAADLDDPQPGTDRKGVDDGGQSRGEWRHPIIVTEPERRPTPRWGRTAAMHRSIGRSSVAVSLVVVILGTIVGQPRPAGAVDRTAANQLLVYSAPGTNCTNAAQADVNDRDMIVAELDGMVRPRCTPAASTA